MNHQSLSAFIWSVADLLRGDYKQSDYGKVILPFTVLRRLDCVLEPTKAKVLAEYAAKKKAGLNPDPFLLRASGQSFYNTSELDLGKLMGDQDHISQNLYAYVQAFSPAVRDIFERFAIEKYIKSRGYKIGTLVAFSGEVNDSQSGPDAFTETSKTLNPGLNGRDIRDAFKGEEFKILLVANKFQTGFDQPLLCGMYVDRRLAGIQAVQTLSRLNRAHPGKDTTYVLDFVNSSEEVLAAFKTYYDTAELESITDPNLVYDLRAKLDASGHYDEFEVDRVVAVEMNPKSKQGDLIAALEPVVDSRSEAQRVDRKNIPIFRIFS